MHNVGKAFGTFTKTEGHHVCACAAFLPEIVGHSHVTPKPGTVHALAGLGREEAVRGRAPSRREGGAWLFVA